MEDNGLKPTEFDSLVCNRHSQMLKAALPYLPPPGQRAVSFYTKAAELRRTMQLFKGGDNIPLGACSASADSSQDARPASALELLSAIRPYGSPAEQERIGTFAQILEAASLASGERETVAAMDTDSASGGGPRRKVPLETIKPLLPPEWQSRLDTMQLLMQVLQA